MDINTYSVVKTTFHSMTDNVCGQKNGKSQKPKTKKRHKQHMYVTVPHHKMSPKGHTELIIGVSRAKKREESFAEVQKSVTPQKPNKNRKKTSYFAIFFEFSFFSFFCAPSVVRS